MGRYVARRLLLTIPVLLGASFLIFAMVYALPGDPIRALAGDRPLPPAVVAQLHERYNLNDPLVVQYVQVPRAPVHGRPGHRLPAAGRCCDIIAERLPVTDQADRWSRSSSRSSSASSPACSPGIRRNGFFDNLVLVVDDGDHLDPDPGARLPSRSTSSA